MVRDFKTEVDSRSGLGSGLLSLLAHEQQGLDKLITFDVLSELLS